MRQPPTVYRTGSAYISQSTTVLLPQNQFPSLRCKEVIAAWLSTGICNEFSQADLQPRKHLTVAVFFFETTSLTTVSSTKPDSIIRENIGIFRVQQQVWFSTMIHLFFAAVREKKWWCDRSNKRAGCPEKSTLALLGRFDVFFCY